MSGGVQSKTFFSFFNFGATLFLLKGIEKCFALLLLTEQESGAAPTPAAPRRGEQAGKKEGVGGKEFLPACWSPPAIFSDGGASNWVVCRVLIFQILFDSFAILVLFFALKIQLNKFNSLFLLNIRIYDTQKMIIS